jgi:hypothetical protein
MGVGASFWRYQPVDQGYVTQGELAYTDAQVGAATDVTPHTDTSQPGDFARYPTVVADQPMSVRTYRPGRSRITYQSFIYQDQTVGQPGSDISLAPSQGQGKTGTTVDPLALEEHGPTSGPEIARLAPQPRTAKSVVQWLRDCLHPKDATKSVREEVIRAIGTDDPVDRDNEVSEASVSTFNAFQMVDVRRVWDTPIMPGMVPDRDGKYHVGKAGYPMTEDLYTPEAYEVHNIRFPVENNAYPFLPDRVRAGAANPADPSQTRPAFDPAWWSDQLFDQWAAQRLTGQKGITAGKISARPTQTTTEDVQDMSLTGAKGGNQRRTGAPGMTPAGPMPSTVRNIPEPWDSDLYVDSSGGSASARRAGWRL